MMWVPAAVRTCWTWILDSPLQRQWCRPWAWTVSETVASQPARANSTDTAGYHVAGRRFPWRADDPVGAGHGAGFPVDGEVGLGEAGMLGGLRVGADRPDQDDAVVLGGGVDRGRGGVSGIDEVLGRVQPYGGQAAVDPLHSIDVLLRSRSGEHMHDDVRADAVTRLAFWWSR